MGDNLQYSNSLTEDYSVGSEILKSFSCRQLVLDSFSTVQSDITRVLKQIPSSTISISSLRKVFKGSLFIQELMFFPSLFEPFWVLEVYGGAYTLIIPCCLWYRRSAKGRAASCPSIWTPFWSKSQWMLWCEALQGEGTSHWAERSAQFWFFPSPLPLSF